MSQLKAEHVSIMAVMVLKRSDDGSIVAMTVFKLDDGGSLWHCIIMDGW